MMDMQEVKARRGALQEDAQDAADDGVETEPMIPAEPDDDVRGLRKPPKSWLTLVTERVWPCIFLGVATMGLYEADFVHEVLHSPLVNRSFLNLGVGFASLVMGVAAYIEVYRSLIRGEKVSYATARTSTHFMLIGMLLSGLCWTIGLWPVWHLLTLPYLFMWFWGVLVQLLVIFPPQLQRLLFAGGYLWFLYAYLTAATV